MPLLSPRGSGFKILHRLCSAGRCFSCNGGLCLFSTSVAASHGAKVYEDNYFKIMQCLGNSCDR